MKRYAGLLLGFVALGLLGCNKEYLPEHAIAADQSFQQKTDILAWDAGMMYAFKSVQYGNFAIFPEVQADLLNATNTFGNRMGGTHSWEMDYADYDLRDMWAAYYAQIADINFFLENYKRFTPKEGEEDFKDTVSLVAGHAHFIRAYCYFELAQRWSALYDANALCVPLVLKRDVEGKPARSTQGEVFQQILADIAQAETMLENEDGQASSGTITIDVVRAL